MQTVLVKKLIWAVAIALLLSASPKSWAAGANVTVATTAGGTLVVPPGPAYFIQLVNTGTTNTVDCGLGGVSGAGLAEGTVSSTNWLFQLQPNGGTWIAPSLTYAPNQLGPGAPRAVGAEEGITCLAISGSSTVHWSRR